MKKPDLLTRIVQNRLALFALLLGIEGLFFVTNGLNSLLRAPDDGWELKIALVDNHLRPEGLWLIPYAIGFFAAALVPLWAAHVMPIKQYRQFIFAMMTAALISYVIYMAVPTYVVKPTPEEVPGSDVFSQLLRAAYEMDNAASTHNAAPSQHVFYALLNMCFVIRFRPRPRVFWTWITLGALISASALLTGQHRSPDLIAGYGMAIFAYRAGIVLGDCVTARLGDENAPIIGPLARLQRRVAHISADTI